jgi:hypothetical protein
MKKIEDEWTAIVCGSRFGPPPEAGWEWCHHALTTFDRERRFEHIIQGGAPGYDERAAGWAKSRRRIWTTVEADWNRYKRAAGPIRNAKQLALLLRLTEPDRRLVLAFPGHDGTENMVSLAKAANIPVWRCSLVGRDGFLWTEDRGPLT